MREQTYRITLDCKGMPDARIVRRRLSHRWIGTALAILVGVAIASQAQETPTIPGDLTWDWAVDHRDLWQLESCWSEPGGALETTECEDSDFDLDNAVDLRDYALLQNYATGTRRLTYSILDDMEDGTEVDGSTWYPNGYMSTGLNPMGQLGEESCDLALIFHVPELSPGETVTYARLLLPATDDGEIESHGSLRIVGIAVDCVKAYESRRPSLQPKTEAVTLWEIASNWPENSGLSDCYPLYRATADIAPILNEILAIPDWGNCIDGKTIGLVIENAASADMNFLIARDFYDTETCPEDAHGPILEIYRDVPSTFAGRELLGRPTDHSVTINALSLLDLEVYFEYGLESDNYVFTTLIRQYTAGDPIEATLDELDPNTRYYYRMRYRRPGEESFRAGPEHEFHTQRPTNETFRFTVTADAHATLSKLGPDGVELQELYRRTMVNAFEDEPDFHIDMGDTFFSDSKGGRNVLDLRDAIDRHVLQRQFIDLVAHSSPFFCVLGNHEAEQGWRLNGTSENIAVWATLARKAIYPLPHPDDFYTGNAANEPFVGLREDYYAWQWGNALFVVLDPYWYTVTQPYDDPVDGPGSRNNWDWTLGRTQYDWLVSTLQTSDATFKFVFSHHVTGGVDYYGRGGVEAACHELGGTGSFEWGGEDIYGNYAFPNRRPGWGDPIHKVMANNDVTIFFHGHDHVFVVQELDGVVYQECPQPSDETYGEGLYVGGHYWSGYKVNNAGHLRVTVSPANVTVEYIRAYLPGEGENGKVGYSYTINASP